MVDPYLHYNKYIDWINLQDVFYVKDMLIYFGIERQRVASMHEVDVSTVITNSARNGHIQRCGKTGANTQYITVSKIPLNSIRRNRK